MSETQWNEEASPDDAPAQDTQWGAETEEIPRKKRGIPKWVFLGCGGGCLIAILLVGAIGFFVANMIKKGSDPEYVWPRVARIMPYDERPEGWNAWGGGLFGMQEWFLFHEGTGEMMILFVYPGRQQLDDYFDPDSLTNTLSNISDAQSGTIELQGRETRYLRYFPWIPGAGESEDENPLGASIRIDLTGDGDMYSCVEIRLHSREAMVTDDKVREMLEPYDIWRTGRYDDVPEEADDTPSDESVDDPVPEDDGEGD